MHMNLLTLFALVCASFSAVAVNLPRPATEIAAPRLLAAEPSTSAAVTSATKVCPTLSLVPGDGSTALQRDFTTLLHLATLRLDPQANGTVVGPLVNSGAAFTFPKFGRCSLATSDPSTPLASRTLSKYFEDVFRTIGNTRRTGISLNRFDLFHAHMMVRRPCNQAQFKDVTTVALVFHSKEYPAVDETVFPYPLGFCQTGSNVTYTEQVMAKRNVVWLLSGKVDPKTGALDASWSRLTPQLFQIDSNAKIGVPSVDETLSEAPFYTMDEGRLGKSIGDMVYLPGTPLAVNLRT
ncbi:hypothetical protein BCR44DRAFT_1427518 [Catenaria anguillulae PL171]|uniref:Uncharacterized protein n=1 Tax=Catenaria anguillulae PL171 TaxID=765915 RepID=A0A1Y2HXG0_9FUNG|nr:hypothetical protein BCR44DRAFT_1427518 [Catenaria anguillulae PL171]